MGLYIGYNPVDLNINQNNLHFNYYIKPPMFAANRSWDRGTTYISTITDIYIVDSYTPTGNETEIYNADVNNEGSIKCYVNDTILTIAGNGSGKIICNSDSSYMFSNFTNLKSINGLQLFDTSNVTRMEYMFASCRSLTSIDLSSFDTSNVTSTEAMFYYCNGLISIDVSSFDTSNVTSTEVMFTSCSSLTSIDLSSFDTSNVQTMLEMFNNCKSLTTIYASELWSTDACTDSARMFQLCDNLVGDIAYDSNYKDKTYATTTGGYLTYKAAPIK